MIIYTQLSMGLLLYVILYKAKGSYDNVNQEYITLMLRIDSVIGRRYINAGGNENKLNCHCF